MSSRIKDYLCKVKEEKAKIVLVFYGRFDAIPY